MGRYRIVLTVPDYWTWGMAVTLAERLEEQELPSEVDVDVQDESGATIDAWKAV